MAVSVSAMTGRLSATAIGKRERTGKRVRREKEPGQQKAGAATKAVSSRSTGRGEVGCSRHLLVILPSDKEKNNIQEKCFRMRSAQTSVCRGLSRCQTELSWRLLPAYPGPCRFPKTVKHPSSDNHRRAVNQFLVSFRRRGETATSKRHRGPRLADQTGICSKRRDAEVPKLRPVAELQTERGVNGRAAEGAGKRIGSVGQNRGRWPKSP